MTNPMGSRRPPRASSPDGIPSEELVAPVVIVGGGPVGCSLAIDLAQVGVRVVVLEARSAEEGPHPGTNLTNMRSMEHFRRWGVASHLIATNPVGPDVARDVLFVTRVNGHLVAALRSAFEFNERHPFSSAQLHYGPQAALERSLRVRLAALPAADVRFEATFEDATPSEGAVDVHYRNAEGELCHVRASYLVGADGSRSLVRRQLGIKMEGEAQIHHSMSWYFRSPELKERLAARFGLPAMVWFTNEDESGGILCAQDDEGTFAFSDGPLDPDFDGGSWVAARQRLDSAIGEQVDIEPLYGADIWLNSLVAPKLGEGRIYLAGESAHLISTYGGFGMNTGIGDAADLGWKLAAAVKGWAGPRLLESYSQERVPVLRWIRDLTRESTRHGGRAFAVRGMEADGPEGDALRAQIGKRIVESKRPELISLGAQLGAAYFDSPIVATDGGTPPGATFGSFEESAAPGVRLPHHWLGPDRSLFDEIALEGYTLLRLEEAPPVDAFTLAARERRIPLKVVEIVDAGLARRYAARLVLVRPDHYVAWRGDAVPSHCGDVLDLIRGAVPAPERPDRTAHATV